MLRKNLHRGLDREIGVSVVMLTSLLDAPPPNDGGHTRIRISHPDPQNYSEINLHAGD